MPRVIVTGGSGKLGKATIKELLDYSWDVINADITLPKENLCPFIKVDFEDMGQTLEVFSQIDSKYKGIDAIVHLAAIPAPGMTPNNVVFKVNTLSTFNVFDAAQRLNIKNVVWASSETLLGLPFDNPPPYIPVDEEYYPRPESAYSLSKLLGETMAKEYCRWNPDMKIIGLRFSNIMEVSDYLNFSNFTSSGRKWNLWGYIDSRDAAQSIRKSLELNYKGFDKFIIANSDTVMTIPNDQLVKEHFPDVPYTKTVGPYDTLLSIDKATRILGYRPEHTWRNYIKK